MFFWWWCHCSHVHISPLCHFLSLILGTSSTETTFLNGPIYGWLLNLCCDFSINLFSSKNSFWFLLDYLLQHYFFKYFILFTSQFASTQFSGFLILISHLITHFFVPFAFLFLSPSSAKWLYGLDLNARTIFSI